MARVKCTLKNASDTINNVHFEFIDGAWVSEVIAQDVADFFCSIPGYFLLPSDNIGEDVHPTKGESLVDGIELPDMIFTHTKVEKPKGRPKKNA